jgi:hypothetical protein
MPVTTVLIPPNRASGHETFSGDADTMMGDLPVWAEEVNAVEENVNVKEALATAAAEAAASSAAIAIAAANFKGAWSAGTYELPASVFHVDKYYMLMVPTSTGTPGVSADWKEYDYYTKAEIDALFDRYISVDTTFYLAPLNASPPESDANGDGSLLLPWFSPEKAFNHLKDKWVNTDAAVVVRAAAGDYQDLNETNLSHPCGDRISLVGDSISTTTMEFSGHGFVMSGTSAAIEDMKIKGPSTFTYMGIVGSLGCVCRLARLNLDKWVTGMHLDNCVLVCTGQMLINNVSGGVMANSTSGNITVDVTNSTNIGILATGSSNIDVENSNVPHGSTGFMASFNSFISAMGTTSGATTPYFPETTLTDGLPTYGMFGSWIAKG